MRSNVTDTLESEFHKANELIFRQQYDEAEAILRVGLRKANRRGIGSARVLYLHALASLFLIRDRQSEALALYKQADRVSHDVYVRLAYARVLLTIYHENELAMRKVRQVLRVLPRRHQAVNEAYSMLGLCLLAQGKRRDALKAFERSLEVDFSKSTSSKSFDLTLASRLVELRMRHPRLLPYLNRIRERAVADKSAHLVDVTDDLIARARDSRRRRA